MSAVDAPPGLDFAGRGEGEFRARPRARRLASAVFFYVLVSSSLAFAMAARHPFRPGAEFALVLPLMCISVAGLGFAVRRARLHVSAAGIRWGWTNLGFRIGPARIRGLSVYRDAVAVRPTRGSLWYLSAKDWDRFDEVAPSLRRARLQLREIDRRAPWRSRLQSYGTVLDLLLVLSALASTLMALVAVGA